MPATHPSRHVVIVGGGVVGLCAAFYCARRGLRVTLLEQKGARRDGCSYGNAGLICPSHFVPLAAPGMVALGLKWMWNPRSPFYIQPRWDPDLFSWGVKFWRAANPRHVARSAPLLRDLNLASRAAFEEIAALPGADFGLAKKGLVMLCQSQHTLDEEAKLAVRARQLGVPAEVFDAKQTAELEPDVNMAVVGSVYFPMDCHLTPHRFLEVLQDDAVKAGVEFLWDTPATGWRTAGDHIDGVRTGRGDYSGEDFVLCCGSWSPGVARDLGLNLPIQAGKGYSLTLPHPRQRPRIPAILTEARVAVTPMGDSLRFGGTMEIAGLQEGINPLRVHGIVAAASRYYPQFRPSDFDGIEPWSGLRPVSPDGLPFLGRPRPWKNLIVATGHAMLGLSLGPITGKLVAQLASGEKPEIDLQLLAPDRYG